MYVLRTPIEGTLKKNRVKIHFRLSRREKKQNKSSISARESRESQGHLSVIRHNSAGTIPLKPSFFILRLRMKKDNGQIGSTLLTVSRYMPILPMSPSLRTCQRRMSWARSPPPCIVG